MRLSIFGTGADMKKVCLLTIIIMMFSPELWANTRPASLIFYENAGATVIAVDKSECSVNVFEFQKHWENIRKVKCSIGETKGDKYYEGDHKTPTGFYWLLNAWTGNELLRQYGLSAKIYGAGAFELNYPNYLDKVLYRKNGYGIWLHGTDKPQPEATRGCIATKNDDLLKLAQFIELRQTPFIVEEKITYLPENTIVRVRRELLDFVERWRSAWESEHIHEYLSFYSKRFKTPRFTYRQWPDYKRLINRRNRNRKILVSDLVIFKVKGVYHVQFIQHYSSSRLNSIGRKYLYIVEHEGAYQIISERWEKLSDHQLGSRLKYTYKEAPKKLF